MTFSSLTFLFLFLPVTFVLYALIRNQTAHNILLAARAAQSRSSRGHPSRCRAEYVISIEKTVPVKAGTVFRMFTKKNGTGEPLTDVPGGAYDTIER